MSMAQKEQLADELFRLQPGLFGSFLVQKQRGVFKAILIPLNSGLVVRPHQIAGVALYD